MNNGKQNLAAAVREARTELGLSQERLAEILNIDSRTIRGIEAGRGNPKFEKLYPLVTYLKIPASKIFEPDYKDEAPNLQKLLALQKDCTEQEAADLLPMVRYLLAFDFQNNLKEIPFLPKQRAFACFAKHNSPLFLHTSFQYPHLAKLR